MGWQLHGTHAHSHGGANAGGGHGHGHPENINVRAAFIHVLGDVLQSIGVFCAAIIIYFKPTWQLADPICTFIFSIIVLWTTITIMKDAILVSILCICLARILSVTGQHFDFENNQNYHATRPHTYTNTAISSHIFIHTFDVMKQ